MTNKLTPVLVIYYDNDKHHYKVKAMFTEQPNSVSPHTFNLLDHNEVTAVIANPGKKFRVFINEENVLEGINV